MVGKPYFAGLRKVCPLLPANPVNHTPKKGVEEAVFSPSWIFLQEEGALPYTHYSLLALRRRFKRSPVSLTGWRAATQPIPKLGLWLG
jgi:hypothetical protein